MQYKQGGGNGAGTGGNWLALEALEALETAVRLWELDSRE